MVVMNFGARRSRDDTEKVRNQIDRFAFGATWQLLSDQQVVCDRLRHFDLLSDLIKMAIARAILEAIRIIASTEATTASWSSDNIYIIFLETAITCNRKHTSITHGDQGRSDKRINQKSHTI